MKYNSHFTIYNLLLKLRTGGVTQPLRKAKKNGVKNLNRAQAISEFL